MLPSRGLTRGPYDRAMRVGVIGAGAVGGTMAALLDRAGHDVIVTARGAHLDAIRERGLHLTGGWGEHLARIPAAQVLPVPPELAVLAVKAQDARAAAEQHAHLLAGVPVVVVQNGLEGPRALHDLLPDSPLIGGLAMFAAAFLEPGEIVVTGPNPTVLAADTASEVDLRAAAGVLRQAVPVITGADLVGAQWSKLVVNTMNAGPAITGLPVHEAFASPALRRAMAAAMRETVRVGRAAGATFGDLGVVSGRTIDRLGSLPVAIVARFVVPRMGGATGGAPNLGSTLQSLRRGVPSEIDHLAGGTVAEGVRFGVPTPVNARIVEFVHAIEHGGPFLTPDDAGKALLR